MQTNPRRLSKIFLDVTSPVR